ncbi:MAG: hypothetical protein EA352_02885 [Gemmatimonadales bacterium]|nr:MAG: hypothetical protein EA352_02885 [Gemmatimonadales bacterium]
MTDEPRFDDPVPLPEGEGAPDGTGIGDGSVAGNGELHVPAGLSQVRPQGPARPSDVVEPLLAEALQFAEEGDWEAMAEHLRGVLPDHPDDPYVLCWLGMAERELGMGGVAHERFRRALAAEPRDPVLLATAGTALAHVDDPAAEAALRTAALVAPELPQARWQFGAWLSREGMLREALDELEAAARLEPDDPVILTEWGVALALDEQMESASVVLARASEADPEDGWVLLLLGLVRVALDEVEEAARVLDEGARVRPDDLQAQCLASLAHAVEGRSDQALEMLERARLHAVEGLDEVLVLEVEERIELGGDAPRRMLRETLGPAALRERLMVRP